MTDSLKLVVHAPTRASLARARRTLDNLRRATPDVELRIVVNAEAVEDVLDAPDAEADAHTFVCPTTLERIGRQAPAPLTVLGEPSALVLAKLQMAGWQYIRA